MQYKTIVAKRVKKKKDPFGLGVYVSPEELEELAKWEAADAKYQRMLDSGWLPTADAVTEIDQGYQEVVNCVRKFNSAEYVYRHNYAPRKDVLVSPAFVAKVKAIYDLPEKTEEWSNRADTAGVLETSLQGKAFNKLWKEVEETGSASGRKVKSGEYRNGSIVFFCIHESEMPFFRKELRLDAKAKTNQWYTKTDLKEYLGVSYDNKAFSSMWEEIEQKGEVGGRKVRYEYRKANKLKSLCIHESELDYIREHVGLNIKDKTDGWLTVNEAMKELRTSIQNSDFTSFWKEIQETGEFQGRKVRAETRRNHSFTTFYIHESELDYVRQVLNFSIPEKTKEWKAKYEFQKLLKVSKSNTEFFALWKELEETGEIAGVEFECGNMQSGKKRPFCINISETEKFEKALGIDKKKTKEWKSKSDVYKILGVSVTSKLFSELWKQLEETSEIDGKKVRSGYRRAYNKSPFCVHESELDLLREKLLLNLPEKTEEWKISVDFAKLIQTNAGGEVFQALWKEVEETGKIGDRAVKSAQMRSAARTPFCVHESEAEFFKELLGINLEEKTDKWFAFQEFARVIHVSELGTPYIEMWEKLKDTGKLNGEEIKFGKKRSAHSMPFCIHISEADKVKKYLGVDYEFKTSEWKSKAQVAKQLRVSPTSEGFNKLWSQLEKNGKLEGNDIRCGNKRARNGRASFYVHEQDVKKLDSFFDIGSEGEVEGAEWKRKKAFAKKIGASVVNKKFNQAWGSAIENGELAGQAVRSGFKIIQSSRVEFMHESAAEIFIKELGIIQNKSVNNKPENDNLPVWAEGWIEKLSFARLVGTTLKNSKFNDLWDEAANHGTANGEKVKCGVMRAHSRRTFYVHESAVESFKVILGYDIEEKTDDWYTKSHFAQLIGTKCGNKKYEQAWKEMEEKGMLDGEEILGEIKKSHNKRPFCVHKSAADIVKNKLHLDAEEKTPEWKTRDEFVVSVGTHRANKPFLKLWTEMLETGKVRGEEVNCGYKKNYRMICMCVHESEAGFFREKMAEIKAEELGKPNGKVQKSSIEVAANAREEGRAAGI